MLDFEAFKEEYQKVPVEEYPNRVVDTMPEPMVSVHVSTYQHADFIHDCLEGVLMQETDFPVEIIIGEDESDDGTREICKEYADQYPEKIRLFLHRRENNIAIHGRPTGRFQFVYSQFVARGKYIAICEGDDYWTDPHKLKQQFESLENNDRFVLSYHGWAPEYNDDRIGPTFFHPHTSTILFNNCLSCWPTTIGHIYNMDTFLKARMELRGNFREVLGLDPSIHRIQEGGMWESRRESEKAEISFISYILMYKFFDNKHLKQELKKKALNQLHKLIAEIKNNFGGNDITKLKNCLNYLQRNNIVFEFLAYVLYQKLSN